MLALICLNLKAIAPQLRLSVKYETQRSVTSFLGRGFDSHSHTYLEAMLQQLLKLM